MNLNRCMCRIILNFLFGQTENFSEPPCKCINFTHRWWGKRWIRINSRWNTNSIIQNLNLTCIIQIMLSTKHCIYPTLLSYDNINFWVEYSWFEFRVFLTDSQREKKWIHTFHKVKHKQLYLGFELWLVISLTITITPSINLCSFTQPLEPWAPNAQSMVFGIYIYLPHHMSRMWSKV